MRQRTNGSKINRVELQEITPPADIRVAMEKQMRAERERRAVILEAEGAKGAAILRAQGEQKRQVLAARGTAESQIITAQAEAAGADFCCRSRGAGSPAGSASIAQQRCYYLPGSSTVPENLTRNDFG